MKLVVDTCVWIEFLRGKQPFFSRLRGILERGDVVGFEPIFAELLQGARNKRELDIIHNYYSNLIKKEQSGAFLEAGVQSSKKKLFQKGVGIIDVAIASFTLKHNLKLWTLDKKLISIVPKKNLFR